jgi:hypothetical protein
MSSLSRNLRSQHVSPTLHFRDNFSVDNLNSVISGGNQSNGSHNNISSNTCSNLNTYVSNGNNCSFVTDDPSIVRRSSRVKKNHQIGMVNGLDPSQQMLIILKIMTFCYPQSFADKGRMSHNKYEF